MTHLYAYTKQGYTDDQYKALVLAIKAAVNEGFHLRDTGSTVAIRALPPHECSENLGVLVLVYTAKGKGLGDKRRFNKLLYQGITRVIGEDTQVKTIMKEQATDMVGLNGTLRSARAGALADFEES